MRDITREILKEWSSNLNSQLNDLRSKRSSVTASSRQKKATEAALRSFGDKQQSIAKIKHYIEIADKIILEEAGNGS